MIFRNAQRRAVDLLGVARIKLSEGALMSPLCSRHELRLACLPGVSNAGAAGVHQTARFCRQGLALLIISLKLNARLNNSPPHCAILCRNPKRNASRDGRVFRYHSWEDSEYHYWGNMLKDPAR